MILAIKNKYNEILNEENLKEPESKYPKKNNIVLSNVKMDKRTLAVKCKEYFIL